MTDESKPPEAESGRFFQQRGFLLFLLFLTAALWFSTRAGPGARVLSYAEFRDKLASGEVTELFVASDEVRGSLILPPDERKEAADEPRLEPFRTIRLEDPDLVDELERAAVEYTAVPDSGWGQWLSLWLFPLGMLLLLFFFLRTGARSGGAQVMGFSKSKARLVPEEGVGVDFRDVAGCDEAKAELRAVVEFLKNPGRFTALGASIPRGVLLLGPPGTGKTLLARALAGEAQVPFFSISGSDFVEMFVGVGAARVRDLFVQAKGRAPCIVFIDEIDAVGRQRGVHMGVVNDEREQTLNQLLAEMDGFEGNSGVILLAATNRPEVLDRALLRPGRFDRQVILDSPDRAGRRAILGVHARTKPLDSDVNLDQLARVTPGMSGADLANTLNEAALRAASMRHERVSQEDIDYAVEKVVAGPERRSRRLAPEQKRRVAYHEAGHALVASSCEHADPVQKISIVPRGRAALGFTMQLPDEEPFLATRSELVDRITVLLGGHAAEGLVFGETSTGSQDDLQTATDLARQLVCLFGMSRSLGPAHSARPVEARYLGGNGVLQRDCSEETAREIDEEVRAFLDQALERARGLLSGSRDRLDRIAEALVEQESLDRVAFVRLLEGNAITLEAS
jgi:cell division protease FtsH